MSFSENVEVHIIMCTFEYLFAVFKSEYVKNLMLKIWSIKAYLL